jgi:hypothetical protein
MRDIWCLALKKERGLRVHKNKSAEEIFGSKKENRRIEKVAR